MGLEYIMVIIFIVGYLGIALEHNIKVDKAATALLIGMVCWGMYAIWPETHLKVEEGMTILDVSRDSTIAADIPAFSEFANNKIIKYTKEGVNNHIN